MEFKRKTSAFNTSEFTDLTSQDNWNHFLFLKIMILMTEKINLIINLDF